MQRQTSNSPRTGKRGDRQTKAAIAIKGHVSAHQDALLAQQTKTVKQRLNEAKRSGFLDLQGLSLSLLPEDVWDMENLRAILIGNNNFTAVPANIPASFPNLQYLDLSRNQITSIPSNLTELSELLVLDFSENEALNGSVLPPSYGPVRHRIAVFVDDESVEYVGDEEETAAVERKAAEINGESDDSEFDEETYHNGNTSESQDEESMEENEYDEDEDEEEDNLHSPTLHKRHDLMEDVALKLRRFLKMVRYLQDGADLESQFQRLLAAKDPVFIKYLSKRFHVTSGSTDGGSSTDDENSIAKRKELKEVVELDRKEKEKWVKGSRDVGRKMKASSRGYD
ncbi:hypothetical protein CcCBS67573_g03847 [Chytriomyces confervae]|uniref:Uncharacterized protein n=1 Tax=Chytriomyces confervae TaxID=246404 RepID=A0A507FFF6_9FUNG|nr:hypothetical protein HDU80_006485 [Chytriomyces hyalinus]TPX74872.1 hypothetical protein CcCBS67573_g03847 [Chytriomyces confervae]